MGHTTVHLYVDDIDGSTDDVRPVQINVPFERAPYKGDGYRAPSTIYEIDLSRANRDELRRVLEPFIKHARYRTGHDPRRLYPDEGAKIRAWAAENKIELKPRGRIPADIVSRFREEND